MGLLYSYEHTPDLQAVMLVRTLALLLSEPALPTHLGADPLYRRAAARRMKLLEHG